MKAMILERLSSFDSVKTPLRLVDIPVPTPGANEILVKLSACPICHAELDEIEGRTPPPSSAISGCVDEVAEKKSGTTLRNFLSAGRGILFTPTVLGSGFTRQPEAHHKVGRR